MIFTYKNDAVVNQVTQGWMEIFSFSRIVYIIYTTNKKKKNLISGVVLILLEIPFMLFFFIFWKIDLEHIL